MKFWYFLINPFRIFLKNFELKFALFDLFIIWFYSVSQILIDWMPILKWIKFIYYAFIVLLVLLNIHNFSYARLEKHD